MITPNQNGEPAIDSFDYELTPVQLSMTENQSTRRLEFFMYECDVIVWWIVPTAGES